MFPVLIPSGARLAPNPRRPAGDGLWGFAQLCPKGRHLPPAWGSGAGWAGGAAAHLKCLVLALGGLHEQVGSFAVAQAVSRALEQQEGQRQLGEGPLYPRDGIEKLDAEAYLQPCPADEGVRVIKVDLEEKRERAPSVHGRGLPSRGPDLSPIGYSFSSGLKS